MDNEKFLKKISIIELLIDDLEQILTSSAFDEKEIEQDFIIKRVQKQIDHSRKLLMLKNKRMIQKQIKNEKT